jgi:hypothetical protein
MLALNGIIDDIVMEECCSMEQFDRRTNSR